MDDVHKWLKGIKPYALTCFKSKMKVYVPTGYGRCLKDVDNFVTTLNVLFNGCTVYDAQGNWYDKKARRVETEPIKVIEIGHNCIEGTQARKFVQALTKYATSCNQQAMSLVDGDFYIAETPEMVKHAKEVFKLNGRTR